MDMAEHNPPEIKTLAMPEMNYPFPIMPPKNETTPVIRTFRRTGTERAFNECSQAEIILVTSIHPTREQPYK